MADIIVTLTEAQERLPELIARISAGDSVAIVEEGQVLAHLTRPTILPSTSEEIVKTRERAKDAVKAMVRHWVNSGFEIPAGSRLSELLDEVA